MSEAHQSVDRSRTPREQSDAGPTPEVKIVSSTSTPKQQRKPRAQRCRFFASRKGCREGDKCPFLHDFSRIPSDDPRRVRTSDAAPEKHDTTDTSEPPAVTTDVDATGSLIEAKPPLNPKVVPKPQSKAASQDPRGFQIKQIKTRFNATEEKTGDGITTLAFTMPPSDPDFPFEIDNLKCTIKIPPAFLWGKRPPSLKVSNKDLERGYQVNIEKGFDVIWSKAAEPTLLAAMKALDKNLEQILTAPKADIIKIIAPTVPLRPKEIPDLPLEPQFIADATSKSTEAAQSTMAKHIHSDAEVAEAAERREIEVRILENRLGRDPQFASIADGTAFDLSVEPRKRNALPVELQAVRAVRLYVPLSYPLEECNIEILGVEAGQKEVRNLEQNFRSRAKDNSVQSLLSHVNYFTANMHSMTSEPVEKASSTVAPPTPPQISKQTSRDPSFELRDTAKAHVKIVSRPVEWTTPADRGSHDEEGSSDFSSDEDDDSDISEEAEEEEGGAEQIKSLDTRSRGVLLSLPHLELFHVALLELQAIHLVVRCERCKDTTSIANVFNNVFAQPPEVRTERCKKCQMPITIGFRRDIMHASSIRAGYIDIEGATPFDLLPSPFVPTCSACMTAGSPVNGVRGDSALAICRECHAKMTFRIPETKFLRLGPSMPATVGSLPMKRPKENLGITAGTELPRTGRCRHYAKSHRWFRFSCCGRVYPCDKCHDDVEKDHVQEFANRIICGYCSREQNYRPEDCGFCRKSLVGRRGRGFWEGGKGTRDPNRMNRKDPRKYKRRGKGAVEKAKKEK